MSATDAADNRGATLALQAAIYRDQGLRARAMTPAGCLAEALELSNNIDAWRRDGAKAE